MSDDLINNLLSKMTLEEKLGQLNQAYVQRSFDPEDFRQGRISSILHVGDTLDNQNNAVQGNAEVSNYLQQLALETRLRIPLIIGSDVIHGFRTVFPIPLAQAATFNPQLVEQGSQIAAREASANGIKWTFAPMVDIARDPRWGRVAEGYGEDPYLSSQMAAASVRGFQGEDMSQPDRVVACAKHFVGYGAAEGGRDYEAGEISEATMRDIYLPSFHAAVKAGVGTLMSAFIDLNGIPATANRHLLTEVLRGEWGFDGFVVSDSVSVTDLINHGVAEDASQAALLALRAGVDMDMGGGAYLSTLSASLESGKIGIEEINQAVQRILRIKERAGLFENPFTNPERSQRELLSADARAAARQAARESMVLLKNDNELLPLQGKRRILVAGNYVHASGELFGTWTIHGRAADVTPLDEALRQAAPKDAELQFIADYDLAIDQAQEADVIVLVMGEHPRRSGENANLSHLGLPPGQADFIAAISDLGKPLVLVVFAGRPLAITRQVKQADAVLYAWHPGIEGGAALGELLFGAQAPCGRLPMTFLRTTGQAPFYYNHKNSGRPLIPNSWFKTRYLDTPTTPLFPFGYGLTYTSFEYANLLLSSPLLRGKLDVSVEVTNTGKRAGSEVVQLYIRDLVGSLTRPVRELKDFQRVLLQPGETRRIHFTLNEEQLAFTRADGSHGVEAGKFQLWVAPDSLSGLQGEFKI